MKNFAFESISMLSHRDRRARTEVFHPRRNLLIGRNHTGKSSLIKTLFLTMGARPVGKLAQWDEHTASRVNFSVGERTYTALHQLGKRALFDSDGAILTATGDHGEWSRAFSEITGFNLLLSIKNMETVPADPACFFLPFYINQDGSWQSDWSTFEGQRRFKAPNAAILEYFTGIKPPEYYHLLGEKHPLVSKLEELNKEKTILEKAKSRLARTLEQNGPKLESSNFENEIESLTREVSVLNEKQELLRERMVRQREIADNLKQQIDLATEALRVHELDYKFLEKDEHEVLECPTCGAEHTESFIDYFSYSEDARVLRELVVMLQGDYEKAFSDYRESRSEINSLSENYQKISRILDTRKGDLLFKDVVESAGSEKAFQAFEDEEKVIRDEIGKLLEAVQTIDEKLKELVSKERSKSILSTFRDSYAFARSKVNLPPVETKRMKLTSRPNVSGSGGPRSILAYYAALWKTCASIHGAFAMPIIIDSPNQQAQDDINMPKVLSFIANDLPDNMQVIVGSEEDVDLSFEKRFLFKIPYALLEEDQYQGVEAELEPLLKAMYDKLNESIADRQV